MNVPPHAERQRSHGRVASSDDRRRVTPVALTRKLTRGPLDQDGVDSAVDDPLAPSTSIHTSPPRSRALSPAQLPQNAAVSNTPDVPPKDFSFLQDPAAYHVLPPAAVPLAFQSAAYVPSLSSPIASLLQTGHYRLAAIAAARNLVAAASPTDYDTLFHLLHIRLACLCLIQEQALASQEAKVLGDLSSAFYRHALTNAHLVPWALRLLVVRLAALGYGEWRKGIMGYYELARECRETLLKPTTSEAEKPLWRTRLRDCGIRVANVLVEMGDLEGAGRHLGTLSSSDDAPDSTEAREVLLMETLVWLRLGDIPTARSRLSRASAHAAPSLVDATLTALILLAESEYEAACTSFQALHAEHPADAMITQNLAVCLLYTGRIAEARTVLEDLVHASPPFYSSVFNLSTVFELCTEKNRDRKVGVAEMLAERKEGGGVGWEVGNVVFKL
ncbi:hypothetical protein P153DRAFT_393259 [Dothidotthia symphoricarpi CBS 119687]|uniref:TPR-like protein n=1 Tax=Dothidotthia symphoricarpi CBS 119687 TaxID=1392245 RepID=A0A6A6AND1_9PLEO|nr:uncharacterized protein P153DRAFT_393259 [Dothidotthia symphoricarpi CBS 119687]KAF2133439.1 hypothetical protein P153DRAFT_393259 [Dothidotthia symphoricarpi CBS 119687]